MNLSPTLHTPALDLLFADWAATVTFREVSPSYDSSTGELTEVITDTQLLAIIGPARDATTPDTAARHKSQERAFLLRPEDIPADASFAHSRILHDGVEHQVDTVDRSALDDLLVLHCHTM
jgi:hypothetical protein